MIKKKPKKESLKMGRPTVMTPEVLRKLDEAFAMGCSDLEACLYADIAKSTLYEYQQENKDFTDHKEILKERPILLARDTLVKGIKGNPELALKFLERKLKKEFSLRTELTGPDGEEQRMTIEIVEHKKDGREDSASD